MHMLDNWLIGKCTANVNQRCSCGENQQSAHQTGLSLYSLADVRKGDVSSGDGKRFSIA